MLTLIFVVLKLAGVIDWDWIWVFSPIWISALFTVGIMVIAIVGSFIGAVISDIKVKLSKGE